MWINWMCRDLAVQYIGFGTAKVMKDSGQDS